jgi:hypothetical protein
MNNNIDVFVIIIKEKNFNNNIEVRYIIIKEKILILTLMYSLYNKRKIY